MSWLLGGKSKGPTNLQAQKNKQIESLRKTIPNVQEIYRDVEYRVPLVIKSTNVNLHVSLPPQFPQEKPVITVHPPARHAWVDTQSKVIGCPALIGFSMHSSLGQVVQSIMEEFKRNAPVLVPFNINTQMPLQYPAGVNTSNMPIFPPAVVPPPAFHPVSVNMVPSFLQQPSLNTPLQETNFQYSSGYRMPNIPTSFPALKDKSIHELNELVNDEDKLLEMLQELPEVCKISEEREEMSTKCIKLAQENLKKKPMLEQMKKTLLIKLEELNMLKNEFEQACEKHLMLSDQFQLSNIQSNLKVAVLQAEEESEQLAEDFLIGKTEIDEFKQSFMEKRTLCHCRRAKEEKLNSIIIASRSSY